ncbi:MAG: hypothetical protein IJW74_03265, partial [Oscillospiraceae bacterium]|nr:hypothetical protein [Oscillospiraceae bacterium]
DAAVQQSYSGSDIRMRPGGMGFGGGKGGFDGQRPEMPQGEIPQLPDGVELDENGQPTGFEGKDKFDFEKGERPQLPQGVEVDENGQLVDENGQPLQIPDKGTPPWGENDTNSDNTTINTMFFMQDKVNNFSGVSDYNK